jgi:hypothetical protein
MPLVAFCPCHFLADFTICMCEFDFRQAQGSPTPAGALGHGTAYQKGSYTERSSQATIE